MVDKYLITFAALEAEFDAGGVSEAVDLTWNLIPIKRGRVLPD